jgi:hypothetical protein
LAICRFAGAEPPSFQENVTLSSVTIFGHLRIWRAEARMRPLNTWHIGMISIEIGVPLRSYH